MSPRSRSNVRTFDTPPYAWPSMYTLLRWGGGGCHGDMSTKPRSKFKGQVYL